MSYGPTQADVPQSEQTKEVWHAVLVYRTCHRAGLP